MFGLSKRRMKEILRKQHEALVELQEHRQQATDMLEELSVEITRLRRRNRKLAALATHLIRLHARHLASVAVNEEPARSAA